MPMLAEVAGAVVGTGTHRDSHEVEIADAAGKPVTMMRIGNDSTGFAQPGTCREDGGGERDQAKQILHGGNEPLTASR